jgi:hypothetical protein
MVPWGGGNSLDEDEDEVYEDFEAGKKKEN